MDCQVFPAGVLSDYRYAVCLSLYGGKLLLSRHRERSTWEMQGGHIEPGETPRQAAARELFEESGALSFTLSPLFDYRTECGTTAAVFLARVRELGPLPESEMAQVQSFDAPPEALTYPHLVASALEALAARPALNLEPVGAEEADRLGRYLQMYLYELSGVYGDGMDETGRFPYPYLALYFTEPERHPYFFRAADKIVGFAMVNRHPVLPEPVDFCLAEFTIFPAYRGRGYALAAVQALTEDHPGRWQLKYSPANTVGAALWEAVAGLYGGRVTSLESGERALCFTAGTP